MKASNLLTLTGVSHATTKAKSRNLMLPILLAIVAVVVLVVFLGWLGLQIQPTPFPAFPQPQPAIETVPLVQGLPAPVERFYRQVYGDKIPVIKSVVLTGRAEMRPVGPITLPVRFRFTHVAGQNYRHYFEATWFNLPILMGNEHYLDGKGRLELSLIGNAEGPNTDQGANLALWAEAAWFPALWVTDPRVHWEPVDDQTALLAVPFGDRQEKFVARFNPETGLLRYMEAMRFRNESDKSKILWITETLGGTRIKDSPLGAVGSATWLDQGTPWAVFTVEDVVYNVDVKDYVRAYGP
jgi:hypothetical protein